MEFYSKMCIFEIAKNYNCLECSLAFLNHLRPTHLDN